MPPAGVFHSSIGAGLGSSQASLVYIQPPSSPPHDSQLPVISGRQSSVSTNDHPSSKSNSKQLTSPPSATPLHPSRPRVHAFLSPLFKFDLPHPDRWSFPLPALVLSCVFSGGELRKPLPPSPPRGEETEPDRSLEFGFHRSFSKTSTSRNSVRQCLSLSLSSSRTLCNHENPVFQKGDITVEPIAGRRVV